MPQETSRPIPTPNAALSSRALARRTSSLREKPSVASPAASAFTLLCFSDVIKLEIEGFAPFKDAL
nr:MAG TPA: hypothetical protein [Caudoviricetes sp.]DAV37700.1 MAG TPA: hypothetical protein [Bacteriophage sp.]